MWKRQKAGAIPSASLYYFGIIPIVITTEAYAQPCYSTTTLVAPTQREVS